MSFMKSNRWKVATFLLASSIPAVVMAQQSSNSMGIVRITDGRNGAASRQSGQIRQASACQGGASCQNGLADPSAGAGNCPPGDGAYLNDGACRYGRCPGCRACMLGNCREHYCKHSPDYGYSPPAKYPLHRRGVEYTQYFPNQWYGAGADYSGARYPMVVQATDTTQLGYYYQHVPFWQPMPNALPPRPIPAQWHIVAPPVSPFKDCGPYGCPAGLLGHGLGLHRRAYDVTEWCPADGSGPNGQRSPQSQNPGAVPGQLPGGAPGASPHPINSNVPSPMPQGDDVDDEMDDGPDVPDQNPQPGRLEKVPARPDSASSGHIRRIGFSF